MKNVNEALEKITSIILRFNGIVRLIILLGYNVILRYYHYHKLMLALLSFLNIQRN